MLGCPGPVSIPSVRRDGRTSHAGTATGSCTGPVESSASSAAHPVVPLPDANAVPVSRTGSSKHHLFVANFTQLEAPIIYCKTCGKYGSKRLLQLNEHCSGSLTVPGQVVVSRINRGLHPSRTQDKKDCKLVGRPVAYLEPHCEAPVESQAMASRNLSRSSNVGLVPSLRPLLDRVLARHENSI